MPPAPDPHGETSFHAREAIAGSRESLAWLVERLTPLLLFQAERRLTPGQRAWCDPEDVVADVWALSLPRLTTIVPEGDRCARVLVKYLSTVLLHRVMELGRQHLRARRDRGRAPDSFRPGALDQLPIDQSGVVTRAVRDERHGELRRQLDELSPSDREVVLLRGIEQRPQKEVGALLGIEPGAVAVRYHRALKRLAERLPQSVFAELEREDA